MWYDKQLKFEKNTQNKTDDININFNIIDDVEINVINDMLEEEMKKPHNADKLDMLKEMKNALERMRNYNYCEPYHYGVVDEEITGGYPKRNKK